MPAVDRVSRGRARWSGALARLDAVGAIEWLLPVGARLLHGRFFRRGVDRRVCRAIHRAARRGTLYGFAPPPPLVRVASGRGSLAPDEYRFRSPFVSHLHERNEAYLWHYRHGAPGRPLVVFNHGTGLFASGLGTRMVAALLAAGVDVAVPGGPGFRGRRARRGAGRAWGVTVADALSGIVQLVHDNVAVESWGRRVGYATIAVTGVGIGGTVAALVGAATARFDACVPLLAGAHPARLWLAPAALARAVDRRALAREGVREPRTLLRLFDPVAPSCLPRPRSSTRCAVAGLRFDTVVPAREVRRLARHWRVPALWLPRRHVELHACAAELGDIVARTTLAAATQRGPAEGQADAS